MGRPIVLDATHLVTRLSRQATTGIDRVDLAYARYFTKRHACPAVGAHYGLFGPHVLGAPRMRSLVEHFECLQSERDRSDRLDWQWLRARLLDEISDLVARPAFPRKLLSWARLFTVQSGFRVLHNLRASVPREAIYLNIAQHAFEHRRFFKWLGRRPDVVPVFLIHDLLPLDFPEFFPAGYELRFRRRVETMVQRARAIITTSSQVAQRIHNEYHDRRRAPVPIHVEPLASPLEHTDQLAEKYDEFGGGVPYFVAIATIEPRKNHSLLIHVWRGLIQRGVAVPKLVVVGKRGWESEQTFRELDLAPDLQRHIIEVSSLPPAHLRSLIKNARALLMPSFAEGYGLPIVEALSLRTPVVCSDIPVFHEVSQQKALLLSPFDGTGWLKTIRSLAQADSLLGTQLQAKTLEFKPPTWQAYFRNIEAFLNTL